MTKDELEAFVRYELDPVATLTGVHHKSSAKGPRVHFSIRARPGRSAHLVAVDVQRVIRELPIGPRYTYLVV